MMRRAVLYTLLGMCLLSGCRNEDFEPTDVMPDRNGLTLSVSASDFVSADGMDTHTRASDDGKVTGFESGDRVGVIIMNETGEIMANNLPYKFDGERWNFDTGNGEGKSAVYYDPLMYSYIVYYPYHSAADECKSIDELKALDAFAVQSDQSNEDAYRSSDLMVWQDTESGLKTINATLIHVRSSFSLAPIVKWELADGLELRYATASLEDVVIYDKDGKYRSPYEAEDGSYRYILPAGYEGDIRWFYTYGETTYGGTRNVTGRESNVRYSQVETMDMGEYSLDMAQVGDFYCAYEKNGTKHGYVLPQEGVSALGDHQCIGIVFKVGKDNSDDSDYETPLTENGPTLGNVVNGYAVALEDAKGDDYCMWGKYGTALGLYPKDSGSQVKDNPDIDWDGYEYTQTIINEAGGISSLKADTQDGYPATYYAVVDYATTVPAPSNSSGWFLPAIGQMWEVYQQRGNLRFTDAGGSNLKSNNYWSSSEFYDIPSDGVLIVHVYHGSVYSWSKNNNSCYVRAVLAF